MMRKKFTTTNSITLWKGKKSLTQKIKIQKSTNIARSNTESRSPANIYKYFHI